MNWIYSFIFLFYMSIHHVDLSGPQPPSKEESELFNGLLAGVTSQKSLYPHPIEEVLTSLAGKWNYTLQCPIGSDANQVIVEVATEQITWDPYLTIKGNPVGVTPRDIGWYQWTYAGSLENEIMKIKATNYIMIDPDVRSDDSAPEVFKEASNKALVYHELLHGQLVMDAFLNDKVFQQKICNGTFDLKAGDSAHKIIPEFEISYIKRQLTMETEGSESYFLLEPVVQENGNRTFREAVAEASILVGKEKVRINWYLPSGHNIIESSLLVNVEDGKIWLSGRIGDAPRNGTLIVIIE